MPLRESWRKSAAGPSLPFFPGDAPPLHPAKPKHLGCTGHVLRTGLGRRERADRQRREAHTLSARHRPAPDCFAHPHLLFPLYAQFGQLKEIHVPDGPSRAEPDPDKIKLKLAWYYRPEEVHGGRKARTGRERDELKKQKRGPRGPPGKRTAAGHAPSRTPSLSPPITPQVFHGRRELLRSEHTDWVAASTVDGACTVHTLDAYRGLPSIGPSDYYWQFRYLPATKEFRPERVPVFCTCQLPYSPDLVMVQCAGCEEWYHPHCVGLGPDAARLLEAAGAAGVAEGEGPIFMCPPCEKEGRGAGGVGVGTGGGGVVGQPVRAA